MNCYACGTPLPELSAGGKINFRTACDKCFADQHCCKNCTFYSPGKPNDCLVPGTDYIADREKNNFCEEFSVQLSPKSNPVRKDDAIKRFNNLFKDD